MYGYIYETTNLINGTKYIGQHVSSILDEKYFGSGIYLKRAIKKYGKNNFSIKILEKCNTANELNKREIYHISENNATRSNKYYNISPGGDGWNSSFNYRDTSGKNNPFYGKTHSEEFKQKMSSQKKGIKLSESHRNKLSAAQKVAQLGQVKSIETRNKISKTLHEKYSKNKRHWYNNGIVEKLVAAKPEGFVPGRIGFLQPDGIIKTDDLLYDKSY